MGDFDDEEEEEVHVRVPAPEHPEGKWVKTSRKGWTWTDKDGIDPKTGMIPEPYKPELDLTLAKTKPRKPKKDKWAKLHPKFRPPPTVEDVLLSKGDPNAEKWCDREPLASYQWAREKYLTSEMPLDAIATHTGWGLNRLKHWARVGSKKRPSWLSEKRAEQNKTIREIQKTTRDKCIDTVKRTLEVIDQAIGSISEEDATNLAIRDISLLVNVAKELHNISQLEAGDPTEIVGRTTLTRDKVLERLKKVDIIAYDSDKPDEIKH